MAEQNGVALQHSSQEAKKGSARVFLSGNSLTGTLIACLTDLHGNSKSAKVASKTNYHIHSTNNNIHYTTVQRVSIAF